jgi:Flp pilus assembly protein TadB
MAIIFNNTETKSELQQRIAAELREKQKSKSLADKDLTAPEYDPEDSAYLENTKKTTTLSWAWGLIAVAVVAVVIVILIALTN